VCGDDEMNRRVLWLYPDAPGRVYVYLSANDVKEAAGQFSRYSVLEAGELSAGGDALGLFAFGRLARRGHGRKVL
jgi:hypothetical protein